VRIEQTRTTRFNRVLPADVILPDEAPLTRENHVPDRDAGDAATPLTRQQAAPLTSRQAASPLARQHTTTSLTRKQLVALSYLAEGLTDKEIARRMGIAQKTASKHIENIYTTLDAHSRVEAVNRARREHLLPPDDADLPMATDNTLLLLLTAEAAPLPLWRIGI